MKHKHCLASHCCLGSIAHACPSMLTSAQLQVFVPAVCMPHMRQLCLGPASQGPLLQPHHPQQSPLRLVLPDAAEDVCDGRCQALLQAALGQVGVGVLQSLSMYTPSGSHLPRL